MATVKLQLKFGTMSGVKTWTVNNVLSNAQASDVTNLMQVMINNGSIYKYPPLTADSATLVVTQETSFDVSGVTPATGS